MHLGSGDGKDETLFTFQNELIKTWCYVKFPLPVECLPSADIFMNHCFSRSHKVRSLTPIIDPYSGILTDRLFSATSVILPLVSVFA